MQNRISALPDLLNHEKFDTGHADRLLGLADQFLEDWEKSDAKDPEVIQRRSEYDAIRPLFMTAPSMLTVLRGICQGIAPLPDGAFQIVREFEDRRDWICVISQNSNGTWSAEDNDCSERVAFDNLFDALSTVKGWVPTDFTPRKGLPGEDSSPTLSSLRRVSTEAHCPEQSSNVRRPRGPRP